MASLDTAHHGFFSDDGWVWWQQRRLRYNLTLAAGGWVAYGLAVGLNYAFGHPVWRDWRGGLGMTIFLGVVYLVVMGFANVCYLLGPAVEGWIRPADVELSQDCLRHGPLGFADRAGHVPAGAAGDADRPQRPTCRIMT